MAETQLDKLEIVLMSLEEDMLHRIAEKLNIVGVTRSTRKFKVLASISDYVSGELNTEPEGADSLFGQVYEVLEEVVKNKTDKKLSSEATKMGEKLSPGRKSLGGDGSTDTDHLAALLQNLSTQPAATSLYRRMFKLNGQLDGRDGLSYISICSQVNDAKQTGYTDQEVVIGLK